jgi:predicted Rossmann fold nucleotide-binding protein DprA/Smf involved in DNA uptake
LIKQGAKLVTCAEDVIEELPTPVRAALTKLEQPEAEQLAGGAVVDRQRTEDLCAA